MKLTQEPSYHLLYKCHMLRIPISKSVDINEVRKIIKDMGDFDKNAEYTIEIKKVE